MHACRLLIADRSSKFGNYAHQEMRVMSMNMSSMGLSCAGTCPHSASKINGALRTAPPVSARMKKSQFWIQLFENAW